MPRKPVTPGAAEPSAPARPAGRTMAEVLALPDPLRQLATWMLRQDAVAQAIQGRSAAPCSPERQGGVAATGGEAELPPVHAGGGRSWTVTRR
jgi:hypothetical protein